MPQDAGHPNALLRNILDQPRSVEAVAAHQFGSGREALLRGAESAAKASGIILSGMGSSLFACVPLAGYLAARGVAAAVVEAAELLHYGTELCRPGSLVVLVSRSGETIEVAKLLPVLKDRGVTLIGVTNVPQSLLAREASHTILIHSFADELIAVQTYVGTVMALLLLGAAIVGEGEALWQTDAEALVHALDGFIPDCVETSASWRSFLESPRAIYLLGRGASLGSVSEGVLLFHEAARTPAVGMSAGHFRHGPVEVVNQEFRAVVFATQGATRDLDTALTADIASLGGIVRVVGGPGSASPGHAPVMPLCAWPAGVPEIFAPVAEIIPIQIAALCLAQLRGITPDKFRFASQVTSSESRFDAISSLKDQA